MILPGKAEHPSSTCSLLNPSLNCTAKTPPSWLCHKHNEFKAMRPFPFTCLPVSCSWSWALPLAVLNVTGTTSRPQTEVLHARKMTQYSTETFCIPLSQAACNSSEYSTALVTENLMHISKIKILFVFSPLTSPWGCFHRMDYLMHAYTKSDYESSHNMIYFKLWDLFLIILYIFNTYFFLPKKMTW